MEETVDKVTKVTIPIILSDLKKKIIYFYLFALETLLLKLKEKVGFYEGK